MSKQDQIKVYIDELKKEIDDLEWRLTKVRTEFEVKRAEILGRQRSFRVAIRKAKELIDE